MFRRNKTLATTSPRYRTEEGILSKSQPMTRNTRKKRSPIRSAAANGVRAFGRRALDDVPMHRAVLRQLFEGEDSDVKAKLWAYFRKKSGLPKLIRLRLENMLKLQNKFHDGVFERGDDFADYCTTEAIPHELLSAIALLSWEYGDERSVDVERRLRGCSAFYTWALKPESKRPARVAESRTMHAQCRRLARSLRPTYETIGDGRRPLKGPSAATKRRVGGSGSKRARRSRSP